MDKRVKKTKEAVKEAFSALVQEKRYSLISVQDILDRAGVGRATFYKHFKTKEEVLCDICSDIFHHISSHSLSAESHHDFSEQTDFQHVLTHMLCHLSEDKDFLKGVLGSEGKEVFWAELKTHSLSLFSSWLDAERKERESVPKELLLNFLVSTLQECILWWMEKDCCPEPEKMAEYYFSLVLPLP